MRLSNILWCSLSQDFYPVNGQPTGIISPPRSLDSAVAGIWVASYFGLLWEDLLCIDSKYVEDYWVQERGLGCLQAMAYIWG